MASAQKRKIASPVKPLAKARPSRSQRHREDDGAENRMLPAVSLYVFILCALFGVAWLFWSFGRQAPPLQQPASGAANSSVYDRGLVATDISYESVLLEHSQYWSNVSHRHFQSSVLAYVTPWNGKGYHMAKVFRRKFTHVSPVWYQLKRTDEGLKLHGRHDVDEQWITDVRQEGSPLIVPRVVLEGWPLDILVKKEERQKAVLMLVDEIMEMQLDGIVLEAWSLWRAHHILEVPDLRKKALEFVKVLGLELHTMEGSHLYSSGSPQLIFVIPPAGKSGDPASFTSSDMIYLRDTVDGFSLMTYDYSSPYSPGPNAPLAWIQKCLHLLIPRVSKDKPKFDITSGSKSSKMASRDSGSAGKILMGINFYGNDYSTPQGGGPIVGHEYISLVSQHKPQIIWDEESQEHYLKYMKEEYEQKRNVVYYPSLKSLSVRLGVAEAWGVGISIWEIGQGLDYFFDLL